MSRAVGEDTLTRVQAQRGGGETPEGLAEPPCHNDIRRGGATGGDQFTCILSTALTVFLLSIVLTGTTIKT